MIKISTNKELRDVLGKYNLSEGHEFDDFEVFLFKYCAFEKNRYLGEFKGYKYEFWIGESIKTYYTDNSRFDFNINRFFSVIENKELCDIKLWDIGWAIDSYDGTGNFFAIENKWLDDIPEEIKVMAEKDDYKLLIENSLENYDWDEVEYGFFDGEEIAEINMSFKYLGKEIKITWSV